MKEQSLFMVRANCLKSSSHFGTCLAASRGKSINTSAPHNPFVIPHWPSHSTGKVFLPLKQYNTFKACSCDALLCEQPLVPRVSHTCIDAPVIVILGASAGCRTDAPLAIFSPAPPSSVSAESSVPHTLSQASECQYWWHSTRPGFTGGAFEALVHFFLWDSRAPKCLGFVTYSSFFKRTSFTAEILVVKHLIITAFPIIKITTAWPRGTL